MQNLSVGFIFPVIVNNYFLRDTDFSSLISLINTTQTSFRVRYYTKSLQAFSSNYQCESVRIGTKYQFGNVNPIAKTIFHFYTKR